MLFIAMNIQGKGIFLGWSWNCIFIGVQERLWSNAFPGTTNNPDGSWTHDPSAMSGMRHPLSHTKIPLKYETNWIVWISEKQTLNSWKGSVLLPDWCMSYDNSQSRWIHQFVVAQICRGYYQFALLLRLYFLMLVYKSILFQSYPPCLKCKIVYNATKKAGMIVWQKLQCDWPRLRELLKQGRLTPTTLINTANTAYKRNRCFTRRYLERPQTIFFDLLWY